MTKRKNIDDNDEKISPLNNQNSGLNNNINSTGLVSSTGKDSESMKGNSSKSSSPVGTLTQKHVDSKDETTSKDNRQSIKVAYFYDPDISTFEQPKSSSCRAFRGQICHSLLNAYGVYPDSLITIHPRLATRTDIAQYHADTYLDSIANAQSHLYRRFGWMRLAAKESQNDMDAEDRRIDESLRRFNIALNPDSSAYVKLYPGVFDHCRLYTTGTLGCAYKLNSGMADIAINWFGGQMAARSFSANRGCFVNDVVLGVLELLKNFEHVMVVNISGIHCDAVEEAFYTTNRVLTVSFHIKSSDSNTGDIGDIGVDDGEGYSINVPMDPGLCGTSFVSMFKSVISKAKTVFNPSAIVLIAGSCMLATDPSCETNVIIQDFLEPVRMLRDFHLPILVLGGPGKSIHATARLWTYITLIMLKRENQLTMEIPDSCEYREYFGPDYSLFTKKPDIVEASTLSMMAPLRKRVLANLDRIHKRP